MRRVLALLIGSLFLLSPIQAAPLVLDLNQAIGLALGHSPDLRAIVIQQDSAVESYRIGVREFLPKVGVNYSQNQSVLLDSPDTRSVQVGMTLSQTIFDAGRSGRKREILALQLAESRGDYDQKAQAVSDSIRSAFNQILVQKLKMVIQDRVIGIAETQLVISKTELGLGSAREIDVLETESQLSSLKIEKKQSERTLQNGLFQLKNLLGIDPAVSLDISGEFDENYAGLTLPEKNERWLAMVLESNKDLAQQAIALHQQALNLQDSNLWFLPNIAFEGGVTMSAAAFPLQTPAFNGKLTFSFPIDSFPVTQSVSMGLTPGQQRDTAVSANVGILDSVQGFVDVQTAREGYRLEKLKQEVQRANAWFAYEKTLGDYRLLVEKVALQRTMVAIEERKNVVLAKQVELGEAKRMDYLQGETQLAKDKIALIESVVQIKESERVLEQLLHVEPGTLPDVARETL